MIGTDTEDDRDYASSLSQFSHDVDEAVWGWSSDSDTTESQKQNEEER